jgi:hypothetical protein
LRGKEGRKGEREGGREEGMETARTGRWGLKGWSVCLWIRSLFLAWNPLIGSNFSESQFPHVVSKDGIPAGRDKIPLSHQQSMIRLVYANSYQ